MESNPDPKPLGRLTHHSPLISVVVFSVSAGVLACEIFLMGLFALIQWHHFAAMILSVALLGFGLSGTILAIWRERFLANWNRSFLASLVGFVVAVPVVTGLLPLIPFTPFRVMWQPSHLLWLGAYELLVLVPFTAGALAIGLAFIRPGAFIPRVYAANLLGSGVGVAAGLGLGFVAMDAPLSEYKSLSKTLLLPDARIVTREGHPLGRVDVVSAPALRIAPGLSLGYHGPMPVPEAVFVNGNGPEALIKLDPFAPEMEFLEWLPTAAPYALLGHPRVLVAGRGLEAAQATRSGAATVTVIEPHPRVARLDSFAKVADVRGFVRSDRTTFDLIQFGSSAAAHAGVAGHSLVENHLFTVEAFGEYLDRLSDHGLVAITRWLKTPPREELRLVATAIEVLEHRGVADPAAHLLFLRGLQTGTLMVKPTPFTAAEIARVRTFCETRLFDLDHFPGMQPSDASRFHRTPDDLYFTGIQRLLRGDRNRFFRDHLFDVRPVTDDRPFFSHFFRWRHAGRFWELLRTQILPVDEWGYLVALATLAQTLVASIVLIGFPLLLSRKPGSAKPVTSHASRRSICTYFAALGLAFMLIEMAFLQKFVLFLAHPMYSASVVIAAFLVFAGIGSARSANRSVVPPLCAIVIIGAIELVLWSTVSHRLLAAPMPARVVVVIGLIAPLAYFMGKPFPIGLGRVSATAPALVPWAWGVNGCFSVLATGLAPLLAVPLGFRAVVVAGLCSYLVAAVAGRKLLPAAASCFVVESRP